MGRTYAGILGFLAFLSVLARCLLESGPADSTLKLALVCLFTFAAVGYLVGELADFVIRDAIRTRLDQEMHPQAASTEGRTPNP